jgi:DnaJ-class molecular chaperone
MKPQKQPINACYRRLGVHVDTTEAEVRAAYKTLALKHHPDKAVEANRNKATTSFQLFQEAYE